MTLEIFKVLQSYETRNYDEMSPRKKPENNRPPGKILVRIHVNGETHEIATEINKTLLEVLREDMNLTGTKHGCELGECGTCAVLVNGRSVLSCLMLGLDTEGRRVETVEGMATETGCIPYKKPSPTRAQRSAATARPASS